MKSPLVHDCGGLCLTPAAIVPTIKYYGSIPVTNRRVFYEDSHNLQSRRIPIAPKSHVIQQSTSQRRRPGIRRNFRQRHSGTAEAKRKEREGWTKHQNTTINPSGNTHQYTHLNGGEEGSKGSRRRRRRTRRTKETKGASASSSAVPGDDITDPDPEGDYVGGGRGE